MPFAGRSWPETALAARLSLTTGSVVGRSHFCSSIIGNLGRDVTLRQTNSGKSVASLFVIVDRPGEGDQSDAIPVEVWNGTAEACAKYLRQGSRVGVTGSLKSRTYEQDGNKRFILEVSGRRVEFLSNTSGANGEAAEATTPPPTDDDLPF